MRHFVIWTIVLVIILVVVNCQDTHDCSDKHGQHIHVDQIDSEYLSFDDKKLIPNLDFPNEEMEKDLDSGAIFKYDENYTQQHKHPIDTKIISTAEDNFNLE